MSKHRKEVEAGKRFEFGRNWKRYLSVLDEDRISQAEKSLKTMLGMDSLAGKRFLDIGSGSGLFSLSARRLGAAVYSFDYDPQSVACTLELKRRYFPDDQNWAVCEGSILDLEFVNSLGEFDIVYSWGVLHHTGEMWKALSYSHLPVASGGIYFIAIYSDQGFRSKIWRVIKKTCCSGPAGRAAVLGIFVPYFVISSLIRDLLCWKNPIAHYIQYKKNRGMSLIYDWVDWLGGYPFEVAKPGKVIDFFTAKGFRLLKQKTTKGFGNNQFVFQKEGP